MAKNYEAKKYRRQKKHFDYNLFFHPSVCHVCKSTNQRKLTLCPRCNMIAYCTEEHRRIHQPHHKEVCSLIAKFIDEDPEWNTRPLWHNDWIKSQENFLRMIQMTLGRKMKPYEEQMFIYAKTCYICHQRSYLHTCERCMSFSYCANHVPLIFADVHNSVFCDMLALTLKLDVKSLNPSVWKTVHSVIKFGAFPSKKISSTNMTSFCNKYFPPHVQDNWCLYDHIFTDYVSDPLTLHQGLQTASLIHSETKADTFNIHVVAANYVDRRHFPAWELFLHLLNKTRKLIITMIGPELYTETIRHHTCSRCKIGRKELILQSFPMLYYDYVTKTNYRRPNVIVGFQAEFSAVGTWSKSIRAMQMQNCPLLLTAKNPYKIQEDIIKIQEVLGTSVKPFLEMKNKFFSYRPYRDFNNGLLEERVATASRIRGGKHGREKESRNRTVSAKHESKTESFCSRTVKIPSLCSVQPTGTTAAEIFGRDRASR
ncbi:uncharacterized protein LOC116843068 [Odontomachus brunneus]|uniref:uncharacterized protein LOC116843068 n=1 Tax=Odontomachus brunneus TaxID=486640 RepID=UPI0013F197CE|nr:uncharacterized protein LOC116843068 [Odontomachus brunneus]